MSFICSLAARRLVLAGFICIPVSAPAQDLQSMLGDLLEEGAEWVEAIQNGEVEFYWPGEGDLNAFWSGLESALEAPALDDLAALLPLAGRVLNELEQIDGAQPYVDWLRQRMDYLEVADEAVKRVPEPAAPPPVARPTPRPPPVARPPVSRPTPRPPPSRPVTVHEQRTDWVLEQAAWQKRIGDRPAPERAKALVPGLKKIFRAEGVPPELVWLAEVESSFNPDARSPVGALGLYQFMPRTAKELGLQLSPRDERRVPEKSATAAARYLGQLYRRFDSWPLALASYNAGQGRVSNLLKTHQAATFNEIAMHLPNETRMYVPKVLATVSVREGVDARRLPPASAGARL